MKNIIVILILSFVVSISQAQDKELFVSYNYTSLNKYEQKTFEVTSTKSSSVCIFKSGIKEGQTMKVKTVDGTELETKIPATTNPTRTIYQDFKKQHLISQEIIIGKNFYVKEPLNQMQWQLTGNTKTILKYNCQEATTTFRGRSYIAYFTIELPFKAAPYKFYGLPGVMLQIITKDEQITIEATSLKIQPQKEAMANPFKDKKTLSWEDFVVIYKKKNKEFNDKHKMVIQQNIKWQKEAGADTKTTEAMLKHNVSFESRLDIIVPGNDLGYVLKQQKEALQEN